MKRIMVALVSLALFVTPLSAAKEKKVKTVNIKVSGGFYSPDVVKVKKGEKVRLAFTRDEKPTCGDTVSIPALKISKKIELGKTTNIDITPKSDLVFNCGMDMMRGKIVVQ
ncbi:MAG TPA: cupredoxin domain-containing protein [Thermoanaerobaculia bacterium]|jgi:plastocyanin domain-containing protein